MGPLPSPLLPPRLVGDDDFILEMFVRSYNWLRENIQKMRDCYVYILASKRYGTLYTGVTSDLAERVHQHKHDLLEGFTKRYGVHDLVWFEMHADIQDAIAREKQMKGWNRAWKIRLIEKGDPNWDDLYAR